MGKFLQLIQELVNRGKKPYSAIPVPEEILTHNKPLEILYDYQLEATQRFLQSSRCIILYPTGFGKTFVGMEMMNQIKPRYLIIANKTAIPQWKQRIKKHLPNITESDYDIYTFQSGVKKAIGKQYNLVIIDEAHWSLAETYSEILGTNAKTFVALTASPFRCDGKDTLLVPIFVKPVGGDWKNIHNAKYYNPPTIHVWIFKNEDTKLEKFKELINTEKKVLVYCDNIAMGKDLSEKFGIPFIYGETPIKERTKTLNQDSSLIGSRIVDESLSIDGIEVGIEMSHHGKSARQAIQRAGRLMHNKEAIETTHHILMTVKDYKKDKDRFKGYYEKGLKVVLHKEHGLHISNLIHKSAKSKNTILKNIRILLHKQAI